LFVIQRPVRNIAFDLENASVDCERGIRLARPICVVRAAQVNRGGVEQSVLRFVWYWRTRGRGILVGEHEMCAEHDCSGGDEFFHKLATAVPVRNSAAMKVADCQRTKSRTADRR